MIRENLYVGNKSALQAEIAPFTYFLCNKGAVSLNF